MSKIMRILGKDCRITIPYKYRKQMGLRDNDVISFEESGGGILFRRETVCSRNGCNANRFFGKPINEDSLLRFLDDLSLAEQRVALIHLSTKWAGKERGKVNE